MEAMTRSIRWSPTSTSRRHCHGHAPDRRPRWRAARLTWSSSTRWAGRASRSSASKSFARCSRRPASSSAPSRPEAGWLADALHAGASAVVPATAGPETLGLVLQEVVSERGDVSTARPTGGVTRR